MNPVYEPIPLAAKRETSYSQVTERDRSMSNGTHHQETPSKPQPRQHRHSRILLHWLWYFLSLTWLAPIVTLLYLNFSNHVIGASVWCPGGHCNAESTTENAVGRANYLDHKDHDTNGALQFVAKTLEVWFIFVATGLVYDMAVMFGRGGRGLPLGYFLSHLEFTDIRYILDPLLWKVPLPHRHSAPETRSRLIKLYLFAIFTAFLTILANLMGPATAVLVLPTLQWVETPKMTNQTFGTTGVDRQPAGDDVFPDCKASQLLSRNYTCTSATYGPSLDGWVSQGIATVTQEYSNDDALIILGSSQEAALQFTLNGTANNELIWIPNRQVLRDMSHDFMKNRGYFASFEPPEYPDKMINNSLQTILQRQGPSLGVQADCYAGNVTDYQTEDSSRWVRCYTGWFFADHSHEMYTKCLRLGKGFDDTNYTAQFWLENFDDSVPEDKTGVGVYFADKAVYFNETTDFGSGIKTCMNDKSKGDDCDWDKIFDAPLINLPLELKNTSVNVGVVSYQVPGVQNINARIYCDHVTYRSFPTYTTDTSIFTNAQNAVALDDLATVMFNATPIMVHPDWFLAAWSVALNGTVDGNRGIVKELTRVLPIAYNSSASTWTDKDSYSFIITHLYTLGQSMSLVDFTHTAPPADAAFRKSQQADYDDHPVLFTWARIHVWAYGLSGRTAKLGVVVVILGSACVIARVLIGIFTGITERSTVEVLAAAFEHRHQGELDGLEEESHLAKVRYQIFEDAEGKQRFIPEKRVHRWSHARV
ncbi:MAG: hypothetical protein Q9220_006742 [cf. Caloplaca sp. 1 TL-2023]